MATNYILRRTFDQFERNTGHTLRSLRYMRLFRLQSRAQDLDVHRARPPFADSFDALVDRITTTARTDDVPTAVVALTAALRAIGGREKPFGPILAKMLAGDFPYWIDRRSARLAQRIIVRLEDISELTALIFDRDTYPRFSFSLKMNGRDVGSTLNLSPRPLPSAVEDELGITPGWKTLPVRDVLDLAKERIAPGEVAGRWLDCHPRTTATFLAEAGIRRMSAAGWRRHEVEAYFEGHHLSDLYSVS